MFGSGILSALSPCSLTMIPATIAVMSKNSERSMLDNIPGGSFLLNVAFAFGLATSLSMYGAVVSIFGLTWGAAFASNRALLFITPTISIIGGLSLLEITNVKLPTLLDPLRGPSKVFGNSSLPVVRAFSLGASLAVLASPCSTPVLATILSIVASSSDPLSGIALLLYYSLGFSVPVVLAGSVGASTVAALIESDIATSASASLAAIMIIYGVFSGLELVFPL